MRPSRALGRGVASPRHPIAECKAKPCPYPRAEPAKETWGRSACPNGVRHHHVNVLKPDPNRRDQVGTQCQPYHEAFSPYFLAGAGDLAGVGA